MFESTFNIVHLSAWVFLEVLRRINLLSIGSQTPTLEYAVTDQQDKTSDG